MGKALIVGIAVLAVLVAGVIVYDHESRVEYTVDEVLDTEIVDTATFRVSAHLDGETTVVLKVDGSQVSSLGASEWTVPAGDWEQLFVVPIPDGLTYDGFFDRLTIEFDGREGRLV